MYKDLPLLDYATGLYPRLDLSKTLIVAVYHILESNFILMDYLFAKGLRPENVYVLGKAYSTSAEALGLYQKAGVHIHSASTKFDSYLGYDEQYKSAIQDLWRWVKQEQNLNKFEKIIVIDEGAQLLQLINESGYKENIVGIEWTSSGYEKLRNIALDFPVFNVARAQAKLELEAPMIARAIVQKLLVYAQNSSISLRNALILGGGVIGSCIYQILREHCTTLRYDVDSSRSDIELKYLTDALSKTDAIIGCVGKQVLLPEHYTSLKRNVVLASASSSDTEFSAVTLRNQASWTDNPHENIVVGGIHLLNCGFPINFDGSKQLIPLKDIQLTEALVFGAVCLAAVENPPSGIVRYNDDLQRNLVEKFRTLQAQ